NDSSGGVVPGVDVVVKNDATGTAFTAVTGSDGAFAIPAMPPGTYTVTVSLQGFKTVVLKDVVLNVGSVANVKATLQPGGLEETVTVGAATEIVQTQQTAVANTLTARQIANIPIQGRGAFDLVALMPGVISSSGTRDANVIGLPQATVNITLDGMNIQDNYAKSWDGMFTRVSPRIDAVEEVTMSSAAQGADTAGQGAVQVKFVTRSGTNQFQGSAYHYLRRDWMNTNTWFNEHRNVDAAGKASPKPVLNQRQPGGRIGGPIIRDKAFFFFNYELVDSPGSRGDTRTIMSPASEQGLFQYGGRTIDLMSVAAANGQTSTIDPLIAKQLAAVRASTGTTGTLSNTTDPLTQSYFWQQNTKSTTKFPTVKLDYNITNNHRASFSTTRNMLLSDPDTTNTRQQVFPGFAFHGLQDSLRFTWQGSVRSTLGRNLVNEVRIGGTGGPTKFSPDINPDMWSDTGGYALSWNGFRSISNTWTTTNYSAREGSTKVVEDTLNWMKGKHSMSIGGSVTRGDVWLQNNQHVPSITLGIATGDPADAMFTTANFPGASSADLTNARNLYAVLTGRITTITREARIGEDGKTYNILGQSMQKGRMWDTGFFFQDSWRWRQNLTVNAGLRYGVQFPFRALNNSYSTATVNDLFGVTGPGAGFEAGSVASNLGNLFKPGVLEGQPTTFQLLEANSKAYKTDWNNLSPSIGAAWTIGSEDGWQKTVFGRPGNSVIRGGYNIAYQRGGMSDFTEVFGSNPGISIDATRSSQNGNLGTLPVLLRSSDLSAPSIPLERQYPMAVPSASSNVRIFDPDITVPWSGSFTVGWQRGLTATTSAEVRFVHSDNHGAWTLANLNGQRNYNELNIVENKFIDEFRIAQNNLFANIAAGRGNTFAYTGAPGTSPLPIFLAHLNGSKNATDPAAYTGTNWTNNTLVTSMYKYNPNPLTAANNLRTTATFRNNMLTAGLPTNFWVVNPDVNSAFMVTNGGDTRYNGIQLILNRRFANGFLVQGNYNYGRGYQQDFYSFRKPYLDRRQTATNSPEGGSGGVTHTMTANWVYELPFGRGRRFGSNVNSVVHRIIGDWSFQGVARFQTGRLLDFGNVRMVGMSAKDVSKITKIRLSTDPNNQYRTLVYMLPQDVIDNTMKAFSQTPTGYANGEPTGRYFAPANGPECLEVAATSNTNWNAGYGDCGTGSLLVSGPMNIRWDMNFVKQIPIASKLRAEFQLQVFNVFNRVNFNPVNLPTSTSNAATLTQYEVTGAADQSRTAQMAFRITW
ncbi:MAG TPA: carboxypeptidase-like regulatory domain-containing protein, partial [Vicinamibacterales bacterium]